MAFFESEIVQEEAKRLFTDYQQLMQLGSDYGKFDREGKKKFIDTMEELMQRYRVFMSALSSRKTSRPSSPWSSCAPSWGSSGLPLSRCLSR